MVPSVKQEVLVTCTLMMLTQAILATPNTATATSAPTDFIELDHSLENTNLLGYGTSGDWRDFNRLRYNGQLNHTNYPNLYVSVSADFKVDYATTNHSLQTDFSLYRANLNYQGEKTLLIIGRQRIPFGVGRIWNPIDIFNPIISTSVEPDEREGSDALHAEYSIRDLAIIDATVAEDKAALRAKGYLEYADCALVGVYDGDKNQLILGWELEGELPATGLELRSEGGFFYDQDTEETWGSGILGAEYGFTNSLNILAEYLYDGERKNNEAGLTVSYQLNMLTQLTCLFIANLDDESKFLSPAINYSLSDEMTLTLSFFLYSGDKGTLYGGGEDAVVLNWFAHF